MRRQTRVTGTGVGDVQWKTWHGHPGEQTRLRAQDLRRQEGRRETQHDQCLGANL